jgi:hypothetical protein
MIPKSGPMGRAHWTDAIGPIRAAKPFHPSTAVGNATVPRKSDGL